MKEGRSINELAAELHRQRDSKRDFVVSTPVLGFETAPTGDSSLAFQVGDATERFGVAKLAHDQLASHIGIPVKYYQRLQEEAPQLLDVNVNHWLSNTNEQRLVRTLDGRARAFLSSKYRPLDNYDLAESVLPTIEQSGMKILSCDVTDTKLYLKAVSERVSAEIANVGDVVQAGIVISNSEVGAGALSISPLIYTLRCKNGMIAPDGRFRKMHVGRGHGNSFEENFEFFRDETRLADDRALWLKVRDVVANSFDQTAFASLVDKLGASTEDKIQGDPIKAVEVTQKVFTLNDTEKNGVLVHLLQGGDMSRYGLLNAVTRFSQDVRDYDRATDLERMGGQVLELPKADWRKIAEAH